MMASLAKWSSVRLRTKWFCVQIPLLSYKYVVKKKMSEYIADDIEISSDSDREDSDRENSNEENFSEKS